MGKTKYLLKINDLIFEGLWKNYLFLFEHILSMFGEVVEKRISKVLSCEFCENFSEQLLHGTLPAEYSFGHCGA